MDFDPRFCSEVLAGDNHRIDFVIRRDVVVDHNDFRFLDKVGIGRAFDRFDDGGFRSWKVEALVALDWQRHVQENDPLRCILAELTALGYFFCGGIVKSFEPGVLDIGR